MTAVVGTILGGALLAAAAMLISVLAAPTGCKAAVFDLPAVRPERCSGIPPYQMWWAATTYVGAVAGCWAALRRGRHPFPGTTAFLLTLFLPFAAFGAALVAVPLLPALIGGSQITPWVMVRLWVAVAVVLSLFSTGAALLARSLTGWASGARS